MTRLARLIIAALAALLAVLLSHSAATASQESVAQPATIYNCDAMRFSIGFSSPVPMCTTRCTYTPGR